MERQSSSAHRKPIIKHDINLAICGHAWHGKSTLLGKTVAELGMISRRELNHYWEAVQHGRDTSLVFATLVFRQKDVDVPGTEGATGITKQPSLVRFEFGQHRVTVIDTPGQETYTNNRFFGMFQADVALLVVDAKDGVMPITEQILRILRGYEIPLLGVAITKMDRVNYEKEAFEQAVDEVRLALAEYEIEDENVVFFPTSAYAPQRDLYDSGEGTAGFHRIKWFDGPSLHQFMAGLSFRTIRPTSPLRLVIHSGDVYDHVPGVGKAVTALVEAGTLRKDMELWFEPLSAERGEPVTARVRSTELTRGHLATPGIPVEEAIPRQLVGVALKNLSVKESLRDLFRHRGILAGTQENRPPAARELECEFTVFDSRTPLRLGEQWTMHTHVDKVGVGVERVISKRAEDGKTWVETQDETVLAGEWARLHLKPVRPVAIEEASTLPPLSRLVLREGNRAIGYGRCTRIIR